MKIGRVLDWFGFGAAGQAHGHAHDVIDASMPTIGRGIWAMSFVLLAISAAGGRGSRA